LSTAGLGLNRIMRESQRKFQSRLLPLTAQSSLFNHNLMLDET
jgi:hypothetical protein